MQPQSPSSSPPPVALPRTLQACDTDCAYFERLEALPDWGWCRDPSCPFRQGLVRPGFECPRFAVRLDRAGR